MSKNEMAYVAAFLDQLSDRFSSDGCNDMTIPDTPENRAMVQAAEAELCDDDETCEINAKDGKIHTGNQVILLHLLELIRKEWAIGELPHVDA